MTNMEIVVAAPVWARDPAEEARLSAALETLSRSGLSILLADAGSPEPFLTAVVSLPGVEMVPPAATPAPRLTGQIQRLLGAARSRSPRPDWLLYVEPDKGSFFAEGLAEFATQARAHPEAGVIVASRDEASFATFPAYQHQVEANFNGIAAEWLDTGGADLLYGPLLICGGLLDTLDAVTEDIGWGWRTYLFAVARRRGLPLVPWGARLPCPEDQRGEDNPASRRYRLQQMGQNITGLALGLKAALPGDSSAG